MSTETQEVLTAPETQNTAPESAQTPETAAQDSTLPEGQADEVKADGDDKPEKTPEQKELERLRRQLTKAQRVNGRISFERQQAFEQLQQFAPQGQQDQAPQNVDPYRLAQEISKIERVTEKANDIAKAGTARFPDFNDAVAAVNREAGPMFHPNGRPTALGDAILDSDDAPALIKFLADNDDIASELENLSPAQLGRRIGRIEAQMSSKPAPKPVSRAPTPAKPIGATRGAANLADLPMDEYIQQRRAQGARWAK